MEKYDDVTSILSISKKNPTDRLKLVDVHKSWSGCAKVISILKKQKIISSITPNKSIQCDENNCWVEWGCRITTPLKPEYIKPMIWKPLKKELKLDCAHLWIHGKYRGCINSYPPKCKKSDDYITSHIYN